MRHNRTGKKPNPKNMRRMRYGKWLKKAAELLEETNSAHTASSLMNLLPDNNATPPNANSAAQKMMKDKRFDSYQGYTTDLKGHRYKTRFFFYRYGEDDEE